MAQEQKSTLDRVKDVIEEQLGVEREIITPTANYIEDLGADSLDEVEMIMALEEEFVIEIHDEDVEGKVKTVQDTVDLVDRKLADK